MKKAITKSIKIRLSEAERTVLGELLDAEIKRRKAEAKPKPRPRGLLRYYVARYLTPLAAQNQAPGVRSYYVFGVKVAMIGERW